MRLKYITLCLLGLSISGCTQHVIKSNASSDQQLGQTSHCKALMPCLKMPAMILKVSSLFNLTLILMSPSQILSPMLSQMGRT